MKTNSSLHSVASDRRWCSPCGLLAIQFPPFFYPEEKGGIWQIRTYRGEAKDTFAKPQCQYHYTPPPSSHKLCTNRIYPRAEPRPSTHLRWSGINAGSSRYFHALSHTCVSVVLYNRKALKVATAAKVIPRELIKFASTHSSRGKEPLESAGKVCEITKDENSGLFQLLWDDNTPTPTQNTRPSCFSALILLPAFRKTCAFFFNCPFFFSSITADEAA